MDDLISRQAAIDAIFSEPLYKSGMKKRDADVVVPAIYEKIKSLPPVQPKGTKLSTVCLLCKKPAVTFNTEDDIPYTNYSYCEDCLRKGLKLLKAQNKMLPPVQPEIIRCKDCKFAHMTVDGECKYCDIWFPDEKTYMPGDYYCASAERKDEAE